MSQLQVTGEAKIRDLQGPVVANSGVITALDGLPSQYVRGDGTLADIPSVTGGGSSVSYYLNGSVNQGTFAGSTYYQMSKDAITGVGTNFSSSTDGLLAQFITDANDPDVSSIPSGNWNIEFFMGVSASSGALASFYVEFYKYDGSTFTLIATNVATPEFLTGTTSVESYFTSVAFAETPLATTDRLAIRIYANVASKTVTLYTEDNRLCQVVTTFSRGILSLNNLTDQQQYFAVGTSGTDFNIVSSLDTHTFNIPTASSTKRGLLSTTDWSTFNNKVPYTGATGPVNLGAYDLTVNGLTIGKGGGGFASNTAIGLNVLASNAGINNLGVGGLALFSNTIGVQNAALGVVSLYSNTSGSYNSAVGYQSIYSNTTGTSNNALGSGSLYSNTTGANNVAIGNAALFGNVSGDGNTSIGVSSLQNSTGVRNTAIGYDAGNLIMTGSYNTIIGSYTGTSSMSSNVILADGQGNIRYRFDGTNNNFYENVNLGENTYIGGFVQANGTSVLSGTISLKQNGFIPAATGYATIGSVSAGKLSIYFGESGLKSVELQNDLLTASRTYDFPDLSGTLALLEGTQTFSGSKTFSNTITFGDYSLMNIGVALAKTSGSTLYASTNGYANLQLVNAGSVNSLYINDGDTLKYSKLSFNNAADYTYTFPASSGTIALTSNLSSYVPYSGATSDVNLGINRLYSTGLTLSTSATAFAPGLTTLNGNANGLTISLGTSSGGSTITYSNQFLFSTNVSNTYTFPNASGTVALTSNFDGYVPYTGATSSLNLGANNITTTGLATLKTIQAGTSTVAGVVALKSPGGVGFSFDSGSINLIASDPTEFRLLYGKGSGNSKSVIFSDTSLTLNTPRTYTLPDASGTLALTSNIPSVSGTSGQVTYFNGTSSVTGSSNHFWDATNNRLGIGLTNPQRSLEIYSATADSHLRLSGSAPSVSLGEAITGSVYQAKFGLATAAGQYVSGAVAGDFVMLSQTGATIFATTATEKARITSGGNLLLGTTSDNGTKLQVNGGGSFSGLAASSTVPTLALNQGASPYGQITSAGDASHGLIMRGYPTNGATTDFSVTASDVMSFYDYGGEFRFYKKNGTLTEQMRITSAGNVGIGTSSPSTKLAVAGKISFAAFETDEDIFGLYTTSSGVTLSSSGASNLLFRTNATERMRITSGGNLLLGTTVDAGPKLRISSSDWGIQVVNSYSAGQQLFALFTYGTSGLGSIQGNGSNVSYFTSSDYRLKEDLQDFNALNKISLIKVYDYKWKSTSQRMDGFIAHELQEVLPYAVSGKKDDKQMQNVDYSKLTPVNTKAIQELYQLVQEQQAQIELLSNKIVALESK